MMTKIKICGVKSPQIAEVAIALGANYIGLVCHPHSKRYVDLALAKTIANATIQAGGIPVAVCVDQDAVAMQAILDATDIQTLQLHGHNAKAAHHQLDAHYVRIYAQVVNSDGSFAPDTSHGLNACLPSRDYLLLDNLEAGAGLTLPWPQLVVNTPFRYGLAGGLNPNNVSSALAHMHADFVDVSSGVESMPGEKDLTLIAAFIGQVRGSKHAP